MLNAAEPVSPDLLKVIDYIDPYVADRMANGQMNTAQDALLANIQSAIRRGHPQMRTWGVRPERVCLVGSGPTLNDCVDELRELVWDGAMLITLNGAYHWCLEHNLCPHTQVVMDARPSNARFVQPAVPRCNYLLASQCAPEIFDAVEGRPHVWLFHAVVKQEGASSDLLDAFYAGNWVGVGGGTTVATRAISLLRMAGYVRFDLFGVDCCWKGTDHHALPQPENAHDQRVIVTAGVTGKPETNRDFIVAPWMLKQLEDLLTTMKINGRHFTLTPHGDGLFTYVLNTLGSDLDALSLSTSETSALGD